MRLSLTREGSANGSASRPRPPLLLAVAALDGPCSREHLAALLWPDSAHGRSNLRVELHRLERGPFAGCLEVTPEQVALRPGTEVDVRLARQQAAHSPEEALAGVGPALLPWLRGDTGDLGEWVQVQRRDWEAFYLGLVQRAAGLAEARGHLGQAREYAGQWVRLDPLAEEARAALLRLCVLQRDEAAARRVYAECEAMTRREFGRAPQAATRGWFDQLSGGLAAPDPATLSLPRLPLVGRDPLLTELRRARHATVLLGDPGIGKSRLALDFSRQFRQALVVSGDLAGAPLAAVAAALDEAGAVAHSPAAAWARRQLGSQWSSQGGSQEPVGTDFSETQRAELHRGLAAALLEAVGPGGCLVIDDLHLLDPATLEVLSSVLLGQAQAGAGRLAVVATARSLELQGSPAGDWVRCERAQGHLRLLDVPPLGSTDMLALVQFLGQTQGGVQFAARLREGTGGNPLFFIETIRSLVASGDVWRDDSGQWQARFYAQGGYAHLPLPNSVTEAVLRRADLLPPEARRCLETLCLQPQPLSAGVLAQACGLSERGVVEQAQGLQAAGFVQEGPGGYALRHDLQRQALRGALSAQQARVAYADLAQAMRDAGYPVQEVARCYEEGGRVRRAAACWVQVAEAAQRAFAPQEAVAAYTHALDLGLDGEAAVSARLALLDLALSQGRLDDARAQLRAVRPLLSALPPGADLRAEVSLREAQVYGLDAEHTDALALLSALAEQALPEGLRARVLHSRGLTHMQLGRFAEAEADLLDSRRLDPLSRTFRAFECTQALVRLTSLRGAFGQARAEVANLRRIASLLGDPEVLARTDYSSGLLGAMSGDREAALRHFELCRIRSDECGLLTLGAQARSGLGGLALEVGQIRRATALFEEALPHLPPQFQPVALANLGVAQFHQGHLGRAFAALGEARGLAQQRGEARSALQRATTLTEMRLSSGGMLPDAEVLALVQAAQALGTVQYAHYHACLRLQAALVRGDENALAALIRDLAALPPNPDEAERHAFVLGWAWAHTGECMRALALLSGAEPTGRVLALRLLCGDPAVPAPGEDATALDLWLYAHAQVQMGTPGAEAECQARQLTLEECWPEHDGALMRLATRFRADWGSRT